MRRLAPQRPGRTIDHARLRARQRLRFFDTYRSCVIDCNLGPELVRGYAERRAAGDAAARWRVLSEPISSHRPPSARTER